MKGTLEQINKSLQDLEFDFDPKTSTYKKNGVNDELWVTQSPSHCDSSPHRNIICYNGAKHTVNLGIIIMKIDEFLDNPFVCTRLEEGPFGTRLENPLLCVRNLDNYAFWADDNTSMATKNSPKMKLKTSLKPNPAKAFFGVKKMEDVGIKQYSSSRGGKKRKSKKRKK